LILQGQLCGRRLPEKVYDTVGEPSFLVLNSLL
jgi:hypothetical protein